MRLAAFALALTLPAVSSALPAPSKPPHPSAHAAIPSRLCGDDIKVRPVRSPDGPKAKRLGDLPPGDLTLTVVNRVGDCIEPVTVRQGYGILDSRPGR
ncbi:MAG: hypothetical protein QOJ91_1841 [Sphingomonadales bacterium]|jgi:hypothetical protein|nr:hypothetical protein [Sphingomonadales bacterium]